MKASIAAVIPKFSTARMVRDYVEEAYLPAAKRNGAATSENGPSEW
jgi:glucan phosphorylase